VILVRISLQNSKVCYFANCKISKTDQKMGEELVRRKKFQRWSSLSSLESSTPTIRAPKLSFGRETEHQPDLQNIKV
jgi:hypothetical protein